jgi:hypothetical protein
MSASTVKPWLTSNSRTSGRSGRGSRRAHRAVVENDDFAAFTRRILAAHGRRIAAGDIEGLAPLAALSAQVDQALYAAIVGLRSHGYSWADVASPLGITRQAAHQRFGDGR